MVDFFATASSGASTFTAALIGALESISDEPKTPMLGLLKAAAMCSGPESLPMKTSATAMVSASCVTQSVR